MYHFLRHLLTGAGMFCLYHTVNAQNSPLFSTPQHYVCYRADTIKIDGKPDEAAWLQVPWTNDFTDIEGNSRPQPAFRTRVKMLWNQQYLYIAAEMEEPHIWATLRQHDTIIYHDNDFEVFIDPDGDAHQYFEIEINAHNTVMDLFMPKPYRDGGDALMGWDAKGLRSAVHIYGSLNQSRDRDQQWTVEMAIPFSSLSFFNHRQMPGDSTCWRINFSRVEWDTDTANGYMKQKDPATGKPLPEHNWVWSPQGMINMHAPERWGYLLFSEQQAGSNAVSFRLPAMERARQYLWQVYYQQRSYRQANRHYAATLAAIGINNTTVQVDGQTYLLEMESTSRQFTATIHDEKSGESCSINQEGKIFKTAAK